MSPCHHLELVNCIWYKAGSSELSSAYAYKLSPCRDTEFTTEQGVELEFALYWQRCVWVSLLTEPVLMSVLCYDSNSLLNTPSLHTSAKADPITTFESILASAEENSETDGRWTLPFKACFLILDCSRVSC